MSKLPVLLSVLLVGMASAHLVELDITVPSSYEVKSNDEYVCAIAQLPADAHKLVGVVPLAEQAVVHHILLYGCELPAQHPQEGQTLAWDCAHHSVCGNGGSQIIYGWGRNAPHLQLPSGVAFSVGNNTQMRYIVAQVHFKGLRPVGDKSGVKLLLKPHATPYAAGVITFASGFSIPPNTASYKVPTECCYQGHQPLTTFAFRVHTHSLGRSVTMERPTWNHTGTEVIATNDPQLPQAFYPVKQQVIWPGDKLKVTCDFNSQGRDRVTHAGSTSEDEMCNMYMMVFAPHPFLTMCTGGPMTTEEHMPGTMASDAQLVLDPCMFWRPPPGRGLAALTAAAGMETKGPDEAPLGDVSGVAIAGDGGLWAFYRGDRRWDSQTFAADHKMVDKKPIDMSVLIKLDSDTGKVVQRLGAKMFGMPHMITFDREGNIWAVDVGLHMVIKMDQQGKVLMRVGTSGVPGQDKEHLCQPTHVAVARDGTFYVADGYCNNRVVKYSPTGTYIGEVAIPAPSGNVVVHSVMLDECTDSLYVAAREAGKMYVANSETLKVEREVDLSMWGRVWSIVMGAYGAPLALVWELNKQAAVVNINQPDVKWIIPGMATLYPHQIALGAGPPTLSGAADRLFALYVAPTCEAGCGPLRRYVLVPKGFQLPEPSKTLVPVPLPILLPRKDKQHKDEQGGDKQTKAGSPPAGAAAQHKEAPPTKTEQADKGSSPVVAGDQSKVTQPSDEDTQTQQAVEKAEEMDAEELEEEQQQQEEEEKEQKEGEGDHSTHDHKGSDGAAGDPQTDNTEYHTVISSSTLGMGSPGWRGAVGARVAGLIVFAALMAVVVGVLSRKLLRKVYSDPGDAPEGGSAGGQRYKQANIDELLARSAELEGIEEGEAVASGGANRSAMPTVLQFRASHPPGAALVQPEAASRYKD